MTSSVKWSCRYDPEYRPWGNNRLGPLLKVQWHTLWWKFLFYCFDGPHHQVHASVCHCTWMQSHGCFQFSANMGRTNMTLSDLKCTHTTTQHSILSPGRARPNSIGHNIRPQSNQMKLSEKWFSIWIRRWALLVRNVQILKKGKQRHK